MMEITLSLRDRNFLSMLREVFMLGRHEEAMSNALSEMANIVATGMPRFMPVRRGTLARSVRVRRVNKLHYEVTEKYYGAFVRGGTASKIFPAEATYLKFFSRGRWYYKKFVSGQPANDYADRAVFTLAGELDDAAIKYGFRAFIRLYRR